ncbi:MAG: phosphoglycerate kinase [bacterium]
MDGARVLVRVDYNVPLSEEGEVSDPARIQASLPTVRHLLTAGARVVLASHLGRPGGKPDPAYSLAPVAHRLGRLLESRVPLLTEAPGSDGLSARVQELDPGQAALLENVRFHPGETANDPELARHFAGLAEHFVGDAFGTAHRAHASNVGAAGVIRESGGAAVAGFLVERELRFLTEALREPERPWVAVLGGAKISGKIDLIEAILPWVDRILVGGAMAHTFFQALGLAVGRSLVEPERVEMARELLDRAGDRILLPVDVMVAREIEPDASPRAVDRTGVPEDERIGDIGPQTRELFAQEIRRARTVVWNGPMGVFETAPFAEGTLAVARSVAQAADGGATTVVGGGDSAAAVRQAGVVEKLSHVSTGGGASVELMAGKTLPGVEILETEEVEE